MVAADVRALPFQEECEMSQIHRDDELKKLSQLIVDALTHSSEVMALISSLKEKKVVAASTLLGIALKVSDLMEISGVAFTQENLDAETGKLFEAMGENEAVDQEVENLSLDFSATDEFDLEDHSNERPMVDGRELSEQEVHFQEWANRNFDDKDWLKNAGLIW
jgi:hypothetical protein